MKKFIGHIGVDSGQIMICDPCYIDSEWKKEEFVDIRRYKHINGDILEYRKDFPHFEAIIPKFGKTMNQMNEAKETVKIEEVIPVEHNFSYNGCCKATLSKSGMGDIGSGVAIGNFGGDGEFPVYADVDRDGVVKSVTIFFNE